MINPILYLVEVERMMRMSLTGWGEVIFTGLTRAFSSSAAVLIKIKLKYMEQILEGFWGGRGVSL